MKYSNITTIEKFNEFLKDVESAETWDAFESEEYESACEFAGLHYNTYDDPNFLFADLQKFMVKKILTDFHNSGDNFDDYDIAQVSKKVNNGEDVPLEDFIKSWAVAYDFDNYFDVNKNESVEDVIDFFIKNNTFDYLEMLENEEYREFMDGIMYVIG